VPGRDFHAQRVDWGQPLAGSARELMAVEAADETGGAQGKAVAFLQEMLRDGPVAARDLRTAAQADGHRWRSLERAKEELGVRAIRRGFGLGGMWAWQLPTPVAGGDEDRRKE
jgi:putative DNA primase/helicase